MRKLFAQPFPVILLFSLAAMLPAFIFGFGGQDAHIHGLWAKHFAELLSQGNLYPRFANDMNLGFGSFVFFFYPPVSLYFDSLFAIFGRDANFYYGAIAASSTLALFLSGFAVYYWLENKLADKQQRLLCALFYMILPIHMLVDFYVTSVIAEFWCYVWFPLILLGAEKIARGEKYGAVLHAVSLALLVMTNIPAALVFIPFAAIYAIAIGKNYIPLIASWILAIGLATVYILPVLAYKDLVNIDLHWAGGVYGFKYSDYFLDEKLFSHNMAESYRRIIFVCFVFTFVYSLIFAIKMPNNKLKTLVISFLAFAFFLCFSVSGFIWDNIPLMQVIQFPRRFLVVPTVFIILAAVGGLQKNREFVEPRILMLIIAMLYFDAGTGLMRSNEINKQQIEVVHELYDKNIESYPNYLPGKDVIPYFYPRTEEVLNYPKVAVSTGKVEVAKWESRDIVLNVAAKTGAEIKVRQFYFPFWKAYANGKELPVGKDDVLKVITIKLPEDLNGPLELKLETLPAEKLGIIISTLSLLVVIYIIARNRHGRS